MPYDSLDNILTKKGFSYNGVQKGEAGDNSTHTIWGRKPDERLGLVSTPDTVTLLFENKYNGYEDVLKKGIGFLFKKEIYYNSLITEVKNNGFKRIVSSATSESILTAYENDSYEVTFSKIISERGIYYLIKIYDKAYVLLQSHIHFAE
jgi:hypothetical protein